MKSAVPSCFLVFMVLLGCGADQLSEAGMPLPEQPTETDASLREPPTISPCAPPAICPGKNHLSNGGFEEGLTGWGAVFGNVVVENTTVRSGKRAARLSAPQAQSTVSLFWKEALIQHARPGAVYCAYAYVRGTASDTRVSIRRAGSNVDETFSSPISNSEWTRIPSENYGGLNVTGGSGDSLYLRIFIPHARTGDEIVVDDVMFWESTTGNCKENPTKLNETRPL